VVVLIKQRVLLFDPEPGLMLLGPTYDKEFHCSMS
jgi:hypothetical protein